MLAVIALGIAGGTLYTMVSEIKKMGYRFTYGIMKYPSFVPNMWGQPGHYFNWGISSTQWIGLNLASFIPTTCLFSLALPAACIAFYKAAIHAKKQQPLGYNEVT